MARWRRVTQKVMALTLLPVLPEVGVAGLVARRGPPVGSPRVRPRPVEVPEEEDLDVVPFPASACPECAFLGVKMPDVRDGWGFGTGLPDREVCPRCHWSGVAPRFRAPEDYLALVRALHAEADPTAEG